MRERNQYGNHQETDLWPFVILAFWGIFCIVVFDAAIGFRARRIGATERSRDESRERPRNEPRDRPGYRPGNDTHRDNWNEAWMWTKLNAFKNTTGISNEEMIAIRERSQQKELDYLVPKFRYGMPKPIRKGCVNPVKFDHLLHNENIEYHNGVIIITRPGYYTFTVQARNGVKCRELELYILIENRPVAHAKR